MPTILVVDDRPVDRELLVTLLRYHGHVPVEAGDGAEALALARRAAPDLVITDLMMPTMDGFELVRQLRAIPALAHVPVIFYTATYHEREARALAARVGSAGILSKPSDPEAIVQTVTAALGQASSAPAIATEEFAEEHKRLLADKLLQNVADLEAANQRLAAFIELSLSLGSERDPQRLLDHFCHVARDLIAARYVGVGAVHSDDAELRYYYTSGMPPATTAAVGVPPARAGLLGSVFAERRTVRRRNLPGDPQAVGLPPAHPPVHSFLAAPVGSLTRVYGWLYLVDKIGGEEFSPEDERLAGILAAQVGRIYENTKLYAMVQQQVLELHQEVAERRRAEDALRRNQEHIRLLLDSTAEAIYGIDTQGAITFCNRACLRMLGYAEPGDLLGKNAHALLHHTRADGSPYPVAECPVFRAIRRNEAAQADDEVFWRADGTNFPVEYWSFPIRSNGAVIGTVVTFLDITERKNLEYHMRQAQGRLQQVVVSSPAVLFTQALRGEQLDGISWISDNLQAILGYPPQAAYAPTWWLDNVHPEEREHVLAQTHADLFALGRCNHEYRFRHGDGTFRWTRGEMRLVRDPAGRPAEVVGSWTDITDRKRLEEQFLQAQKMEAVGRLAGGVAHDFNNLLTIINGYSDLVRAQLSDASPLRPMVEEIAKSGNRAAGLTRQLLAFSRKSVLVPAVLDLNALVCEMEKMLRRLIGEDIELHVAPDPQLWPIKADPTQLEQVVMNLVINARDAMPRGGKLTIETRNVELDAAYAAEHRAGRPGPHVLLAITDNGSGMDPATRARIFEPFFTTKGPEKGTGLGLATVYGIVEQSGGRIEVYSEVGLGSSFKIYIPRCLEPRRPSPSRTGVPRPGPGSETILLVEDDPGVRGLSRLILEDRGYHVLEAATGAEALLVCQQHTGPLHLLVSDVVMPAMSGPQLADRLLALRPGLKRLFLSGYTDEAIVHHGLIGPDVPFLEKPFTPDALAKKVRDVLDS